jgi:hypothetical protein
MKTKTFDCLRLKDEAQQRRAERLRGLSEDEQLRYYDEGHAALIRRQAGQHPNQDDPAAKTRELDGATVLDRIAKLAESSDDLPPDYAEQHEHYVKGAPRK